MYRLNGFNVVACNVIWSMPNGDMVQRLFTATVDKGTKFSVFKKTVEEYGSSVPPKEALSVRVFFEENWDDW